MRGRRRGVHTIEASVLVPIVLTVVLVLCNFTAYLFAQGQAQRAAQRLLDEIAQEYASLNLGQQMGYPTNFQLKSAQTQKLMAYAKGAILSIQTCTISREHIASSHWSMEYRITLRVPFKSFNRTLQDKVTVYGGSNKAQSRQLFEDLRRQKLIMQQVEKVDQLPQALALLNQAYTRLYAVWARAFQ